MPTQPPLTEQASTPLPIAPAGEGSPATGQGSPPDGRRDLSTSWARLRSHKTVQWTVAYIAFTYALLQLISIVRDAFDWPYLVTRLSIATVPLGIPVVALLAWHFHHPSRRRVRGWTVAAVVVLLFASGVVLWRMSGDVDRRTMAVASSPPASVPDNTQFDPPERSIAVMPFVNVGGDPAQIYFSDGLTEEIINSLATIAELRVSARTSSFSFRDRAASVPVIARTLDVGTIIEGSVRRAGDKVRIAVQLVNGRDGYNLWSKVFDRTLEDVFAVQSEIAANVTRILEVRLRDGYAERIAEGGTTNPRALDAYLRARRIDYGSSPDDFRRALALYDEAVRLDPAFARAHASRVQRLLQIAEQSADAGEQVRLRSEARAEAERAVALAPRLAFAHAALGDVRWSEFDFTGALEAFEHALSLAPRDSSTLILYTQFAASIAHCDKAIAMARQAVVLDPLYFSPRSVLGDALHYCARRYPEAIAEYQASFAMNPRWPVSVDIAFVELATGHHEEARRLCTADANTNSPHVLSCLAIALSKLGLETEARQHLQILEKNSGASGAYLLALAYAQRNEPTTALSWLREAVKRKEREVAFLPVEPMLDPLRQQKDFQALYAALHFPP